MNYRLLRNIHNYSSVVLMLLVVFFTITGVTLNHRDWFSTQADSNEIELNLPDELISINWQENPVASGQSLKHWLVSNRGLENGKTSYHWSEDEQLLTIDIKRPGGFSSVEFSPSTAELLIFNQHNGLVAVLNDLHMGRSSGPWWKLVIDITAVIMLLFIFSGFCLIFQQKKRRHILLGLSGIGVLIMAGSYWIALL